MSQNEQVRFDRLRPRQQQGSVPNYDARRTQVPSGQWVGSGQAPRGAPVGGGALDYRTDLARDARSVETNLTSNANALRRQPDVGASPWDFLAMLTEGVQGSPSAPSGGGGGRRGGGGGGGGAGVNQDAYRQVLAQMMGQDVNPQFDALIARLGQIFDPRQVNERMTGLEQAVGRAADAGTQRVGGIIDALGARANQARGAVRDAFGESAAGLQNAQRTFGAAPAVLQGDLNRSLAAMGAGSAGVDSRGVNDLMEMARMGSDRDARTFDAMLADRQSIYGGLDADVRTGMSRDQDGLMTQIANRRTSELAGLDAQRQQQTIALELQRLEQQQRQQDAMNQLRLEAARAGFTI
jgi:hypothetical protein